MKSSLLRIPSLSGLLAAFTLCTLAAVPAQAGATKTEVVKTGSGFKLMRDGKEYVVKGAGGDGPLDVLAESGGNSLRTWGSGPEIRKRLDEAEKLGISVTVGVWLPHKFDWNNENQVKGIMKTVEQTVRSYNNHPAVLCWAIGNEMEMDGRDGPALWKAVEEMAKRAKELDPDHPTMTVVADFNDQKLKNIKEFCPSIDIIGVNSYAGAASVAGRFKRADPDKPYILTEFGPPGPSDGARNKFGAADEPTSSEKSKIYEAAYKANMNSPLCLGSYVFTWGFKREVSATWYGLFLPDGSKLPTVDAMAELWSGQRPKIRCPELSAIKIAGSDQPKAGSALKASVIVRDPQGARLDIEWTVVKEMESYGLAGTGAAETKDFSGAIKKNGEDQMEMTVPNKPGVYRIFCFVRNKADKTAATSSIAIKVQ
jgi:hypothetical protein